MSEYRRLRFVAPLRARRPDHELLGELAFLPMEAIGEDGTFDRGQTRPAGEIRDQGYTWFCDGDVIRARVTPCFENGKGALLTGLAGGEGFGTTELFVFRPGPDIDPRFLFYVTHSIDFVQKGAATIYGAHGVKRVDDAFARDYRVWLPSLDEQRAIAGHLDRETARIDALITAKQSLAERLRERFRRQRCDLVTGAPARKTRRAPNWIGSIPASWCIKRLKFVARMDSGHTPSRQVPEYWVDCSIPWITLNDVSRLELAWRFYEPVNAINELGMRNSAAHILPADSVVLSRDATVGRSALLGRPMAVSQHFVAWICGSEVLPEYLLNVIRGPMQLHFGGLTAGATIATIGMPDLGELVTPVPPLEEQQRIVRAIEIAERGATAAIAALDRQLALLRERRQSLITAAVMGDLPVPVPA